MAQWGGSQETPSVEGSWGDTKNSSGELTLHGDGQDADGTQRPLPVEGVHVLIKEVHGQVLGQSFGLLKELWLQEKVQWAF